MGTLFNDIIITRTNPDGSDAQVMRVPLTYAPKDKMLSRIVQDPNLDLETAITLPRMSFEIHGYEYDGNRKLNTLGLTVRRNENDPNKFRYMYNPVPYNFPFSLYVYVKNAEDGTKIMEQILPYFRPEWSATLNLIPEMDLVNDIDVVYQNTSMQDIYDGQFTERRALVYTLSFVLKGWLYGPIKSRPIIKFSNTNFYFGGSNTANIVANSSELVSSFQVTPGVDANGNPTTDPNTAIDPYLVEFDDDWDYVIQKSGLIIVED